MANKCTHCGNEGEGNFFKLQDVPFCGECGRKLQQEEAAPVTPVKTAPTGMEVGEWVEPSDNVRGRTPSTIDRLNALKQQMNDSPAVNNSRSRLSVISKGREVIAKQRNLTSRGSSPGPVELMDSAGDKAVTITKAKLLQIQKALTERVKADCHKAAQQDMEVMEMEIETLRKESDKLIDENTSLKATLDEVMGTFETAITEHDATTNEYKVQVGLLQMDLKQANQTAEQATSQHKELFKEFTIMKGQLQALQSKDNTGRDSVDALQVQLRESQANFEALKQHAGQKLKAAGSQFIEVQKTAKAKSEAVSSLEDENAILKTKLSNNDKKFNELEANVSDLTGKLQQAQEQAATARTLSASLQSKNTEVVSLKGQVEAIRTELATSQGSLKALEQRASAGVRAEGMLVKLNEVMHQLEQENTSLKSKLYEATSGGGGGGNGGKHTQQLESDLLLLQSALDKKEKENQEIVMICEELMKEIEQLKAGN